MELWKRRVVVSVGNHTFGEPLKIEFDIAFSETPDTDIGSIRIWNLSKNTLNTLKSGMTLRITAGYQETYGNIFNGEVVDILTTWQGVDKITEFVLADSTKQYRSSKLTKSFAPNTTSDEILLYLIAKAGLGIGEFNPVKTVNFPNGITINEGVQSAIKKMIIQSQSKYYVKGGMAYVRNPSKGDMRGFVVSKETGLIDMPELSVKEIKEKEYKGYKIKMLLNHEVTTDSIVQIKSRTANGLFRVSSGAHESSNDFLTTAEVYPI